MAHMMERNLTVSVSLKWCETNRTATKSFCLMQIKLFVIVIKRLVAVRLVSHHPLASAGERHGLRDYCSI